MLTILSRELTCKIRGNRIHSHPSKLKTNYASYCKDTYKEYNLIENIGILSCAYKVLTSNCPLEKANISINSHNFIKTINEENLSDYGRLLGQYKEAPDFPARPEEPQLLNPTEMPTSKKLKVNNVDYLLHGLAHIELNAIDTCWDTILRFNHENMPFQFYKDFISIASDESRHFIMLYNRLKERGAYYGFIPAHNAIWNSAYKTKDNLKARIVAIQLVQESRALDSWDRLVNKLRSQGDKESSKMVDQICNEEIDHVSKGVKWFSYLCERDNEDTINKFHELVREYVGIVPPPFNSIARNKAGMTEEWYVPIAKKNENIKTN